MAATVTTQCDMAIDNEEHVCEGTNLFRRGDLLVCGIGAQELPWHTGRVEGERRCWCGGFRAIGEVCGEPCDY
jgi:hypothetical protein